MKRTLVLSLAVSALLYGCTQPIATVEETTPVSRNMFNEEVRAPLNFEQMREIVAGVLGDEVASRITPTSRYVRVQFDDAGRIANTVCGVPRNCCPNRCWEKPTQKFQLRQIVRVRCMA